MTTNRRQVLRTGMACLATMAGSKWQTSGAADSVRHLGHPNSKINGVQIGVQTYSFRNLPDQSVEAILRYCREVGINAVELQGSNINDPVEAFAGFKLTFDSARFSKVEQRSAARPVSRLFLRRSSRSMMM
jgi:hypothetical protein